MTIDPDAPNGQLAPSGASQAPRAAGHLRFGWIALLVFGRAEVACLMRGAARHPIALVGFLAVVSYAASHAIGPGDAHDSGLYHYAIIQWAMLEPVVPGMGNLSVTFAHNSVHLLFAAAIDQGPLGARSEHVLNGIVLFVMSAMALRGIALAISREGNDTVERHLCWFDAMLIVPIVMVILSKEMSSPKTDAAPAFVILLMVRQLAVIAGGHSPAGDASSTGIALQWRFITLAVLGALAFAIKLSTAPFLLAMFITLQLIVFIGEAVREAFDPKVYSRLR